MAEEGSEIRELTGVVVTNSAKDAPQAPGPANENTSSEIAEAAPRMMTLAQARLAIEEMLTVESTGITSEAAFKQAFDKLAPALMVFGPHIIRNSDAATGNSRSIRPQEYRKAAWKDEDGAEQVAVMWPRDVINRAYGTPNPTDEDIDRVQAATSPNEVHVYTNRFVAGREQSDFDFTMFNTSGVLGPSLQVTYTTPTGEQTSVDLQDGGGPKKTHEYSLAAKGTLHALKVLRSRDAAILKEKASLEASGPPAIPGSRGRTSA